MARNLNVGINLRCLAEEITIIELNCTLLTNTTQVDAGRGSATWEGWRSNPWCRAEKGQQRYDQMFLSTKHPPHLRVLRTAVHEERYRRCPGGDGPAVYASDH